jgi:hypothetical protein
MYKSTINSILKIAILGLVLFIITGCGSRYHIPKPSDVQVFKKAEKTEKITLFNQEFDMPEPVVIKSKLYPSNKLKGKINDSWYYIDGHPRKINYKTFCFSQTSSRRFQVPYYALKFPSKMIINNVYIYHTEEAYNDKKESIKINPYLYKTKDRENMKTYALFNRNELYETNKVTKFIDVNSSTNIDAINYYSTTPIKQLFIAFDDLQDMAPTKYIVIKKKPIFKIDGYSPELVVLAALKTRKDLDYNEKLVREVGFKDAQLFRKIQRKVRTLNLPKSSVARLPQDVNIKYALRNHATILKTGRYLAKTGRYKHIKTKSFFDSSYKYKSTHTVKVNGKKASMKKSTSEHKTAGFIDLSQGI